MNAQTHDDDTRATVIYGSVGRDAGKAYRINEVSPFAMSGFVLRLLSAMHLTQPDDLMDLLQPATGTGADIKTILCLLSGCDPTAVHALVSDALVHVEVAPDPKHPTAFRRLNVELDIREMATLGDVLGGFARCNLMPG